jgi:hypothetical protein
MPMDDDHHEHDKPPRPPLQFSVRAMFVITVVVGLLFGLLRWLEVPPLASTVVLVILMASVGLAFGLVLAIAHLGDRDE